MPTEQRLHLAADKVVDAHRGTRRAIRAMKLPTDGQPPTVRRQSQRKDGYPIARRDLAADHAHCLVLLNVPDPDGLILRARHDLLAVRSDGEAIDLGHVPTGVEHELWPCGRLGAR